MSATFDGSIVDGKKQGKGRLITSNFFIHKCRWKDDMKQGVGNVSVHLNHIFVLGGDDGKNEHEPTTNFYCYSITENNKWRKDKLPPFSIRRSVSNVIFMEHYLYLIGGYDGNKSLSSVERFDFLTQQWKTMSNMNYRRASLNSIERNGKIYTFGGLMGNIVHSSIEEYDPILNKWRIFQTLQFGRSGCGMVYYQDKIYLFGGISLLYKDSIPLEIFDFKTKTSKVHSHICISGHSLTSSLVFRNNKPTILISQAKNIFKNQVCANVYAYDIETNSLQEITPFHYPRLYSSFVSYKNNFYVIGGIDKNKLLVPMECYNFETNKWNIDHSFLHSYSGMAIISIENVTLELNGKWNNDQLKGKAEITINDKTINGIFKKNQKESLFTDNHGNKIFYVNDVPICQEQYRIEKKLRKITIPHLFQCPISYEIMFDPVITTAGITYERKNIEKWLETNDTDPITRHSIKKDLISNLLIKKMIFDFLEKKNIK